jgi:hypothetical protein
VSIDFSNQQWNRVLENADKWWAGQLGRPLIQVRLTGKEPGRKPSKYPFYEFTSFYEPSVSADEIVDAWDYDLCCTEFLGDAFPVVVPNFGAGSMAAYLGARLQNGKDAATVWFHPEKDLEIDELDFAFVPDNKWFIRTKEVVQAAVGRWQGRVQVALTDLGGNMDILATFRPSGKLMFDLFDHPEDVKRLNWKVHEMWWRYFDEFNSITKGVNPGYSNWARIFSEETHYILQCDFCFLISPDMFEEFVRPELIATSEKLANVFYHLDGPGELTHLDSILDIDTIQGIQWVPGAGSPDVTCWPDVYRRITDAGKKIHIVSNMADDPLMVIDKIADQTGRADNIVYHFDGDISQREAVEDLLTKYSCI